MKIIKARKITIQEFTPYTDTLDMSHIPISEAGHLAGSPKTGDMIALNPDDPIDKLVVAEKFFKDNYEVVDDKESTGKTLGNTDANGASKNVKDIKFWGDGDTFKLISKASSESEGWFKSTKAMHAGIDVVVQVTTQQKNPDGSYAVAEALTTVQNARIVELTEDGKVVKRKIVAGAY